MPDTRAIPAQLLTGTDLYREVILKRLASARRSAWISTANVKAMLVERGGTFAPVVDLFADLGTRGVSVRLLHADRPSRAFREAFDHRARALRGVLEMRVCPRVHFKTVIVDDEWLYLGSANLTGAGLGAKDEHRRNFETGLGTTDPEVLDHVRAMYQAIWSGAECGACKLRKICPAPLGPADPSRAPRRRRAPRTQGIVLGRARRLPLHGG